MPPPASGTLSRAIGWLKHLTTDRAPTSLLQAQPRGVHPEEVTILGIGIPESDRWSFERIASRHGWKHTFISTCAQAEEELRLKRFAVILCDRDQSGMDWRAAVERLSNAARSSCVVLVSAVDDEYLWQEVVMRGGFDVLTKPFSDDQVRRRVDHAWLFWKSRLAWPQEIRK